MIKLQDILPFFPDFVLIDDFKNEICQALQEYNQDIDELKMELQQVMNSSDSIRVDMRQLIHRFARFPVSQECELCKKPVLNRVFYVFPCHHVFHGDCLIDLVVKESVGPKAKKILELKSLLSLFESDDTI